MDFQERIEGDITCTCGTGLLVAIQTAQRQHVHRPGELENCEDIRLDKVYIQFINIRYTPAAAASFVLGNTIVVD
jgi:hypothetical protein